MNMKNSKKIVPATVFAAIIVLLAFSVMSTTAIIQEDKLVTMFDSERGNLGDVVDVTIDVTNVNDVTQTVKVVDTLPAGLTYICGTFTVNGKEAVPTVDKQVISYNIINPDVKRTYKIMFNVKVTEAYWENRNVKNVVVGTWYDDNGNELKTITDTAEFNIVAFTNLYETMKEGSTEPVIGVEENWKIEMCVENKFDYTMKDTKITENFAGNLKIESITVGETTYLFRNYKNYGTMNKATVEIYIPKDEVWKTVKLDKDGVTTQDDSHIYWTGRTHTAHVVWNIGELKSSAKTGIIIGVSTDTNPAGEQLYGSTGIHYLNSGATLTFNDKEGMMQLSAVAAPIAVTAVAK